MGMDVINWGNQYHIELFNEHHRNDTCTEKNTHASRYVQIKNEKREGKIMKLLALILIFVPLLYVYTILSLGGLFAVSLYIAYVVLAYVNYTMFKTGIEMLRSSK